ncbi:MAG TPA: hypothetical protein VFH27_08650 [Longimicrobiaceae bacterium]|nr:hypothetical protein [Longimicrobiaceae bacterium]
MYRTIYDVRDVVAPSTDTVLMGVALVAAGVAIWTLGQVDAWLWSPGRIGHEPLPAEIPPPLFPRRGVGRLEQARYFRVFGLVFALGAASISLGIGAIEVTDRNRLVRALAEGRYEVVEGRVTDFTPGDAGGHQQEVWSVWSGGALHTYRYSSPSWIPGFHQSHGPIHAGMQVRIADVRGAIARLEAEPAETREGERRVP